MAEIPKKQFKSQSVNSLFRQQATSKSLESTSNLRRTSRSPTPGPASKVKLVSRRKGSAIKRTSPTPPATTAPSSTNPSTPSTTTSSVEVLSTGANSLKDDQDTEVVPPVIETKDTTIKDGIEEPTTESTTTSTLTDLKFQDPKVLPSPNQPTQQNSTLGNEEWNHIQSQITTETTSSLPQSTTSTSRSQSELMSTLSPTANRTWSSPNSKISSFRRNVASPMIQSFSQSPLTNPVESPFPDVAVNRTPMGFLGDRLPTRMSESRSNTLNTAQMLDEDSQWAASQTIWNTEDRDLSTKSDSAVNSSWAHLDLENLNLNESFNMQSSRTSITQLDTQQGQAQPQSQSQSRSGSRTSRFFPSPIVEQNPSFDHFPRQPSVVERSSAPFRMAPPQFNLFQQMQQQTAQQPLHHHHHHPQQIPIEHFAAPPGIHDEYAFQGRQLFHEQQYQPQPQYPPSSPQAPFHDTPVMNDQYLPVTFEPSSQPLDRDVFPDSFRTDVPMIPVSLPPTFTLSDQTHQPYSRRSTSYEQVSHPEGFASTFYKRGNNNFMFIRELQPKLVTSKHRDTVEVRVSFPSITAADENDTDEAQIKMRCHIVNVDIKELEGRIAGVKIAKGGSSGNGRSRGFGRGGNRGRRNAN